MVAKITLLLMIAVSASASCRRAQDVNVEHFLFKGTQVQAALELARQTGVCLGMRNLPHGAFLEEQDFSVRNKTAMQVLRTIFPAGEVEISPGRLGTINVFRPSHVDSLFDHRIAEFKVERAPVQVLSAGIKLRLERELHPELQGFAGRIGLGDRSDVAGPFDVKGATVSELLDLIVSDSMGASWVALAPDRAAMTSVPTHMWTVVEYARPISDYKGLLDAAAENYPEASFSK